MAVVSRRGAEFRISRKAFAAGVVFIGAFIALAALQGDGDEPVLTPAQSESAALDSPRIRQALAQGYTRVLTMPLDQRTVRVSFLDGPRAVADAAVGADGRVQEVITHEDQRVRVGSEVGQSPAVLGGLVALFLLATLRLPLVRRHNIDAIALAGVAVPILLLNTGYPEWSVLVAAGLLVYLGWRCLGVATGRAVPGGWLIAKLPRRVTLLLTAGAAAALALLSIPGGLVSDVGYASMAGATQILDGRLPYGNLPTDGLVHGDTYPLLAYLAYVPAALVDPVRDGFDGLDGALWVATAFALAAAAALGRAAGPRVALAFLAFPPVMIAASSGSNDAVAAACVAGALACAARGGVASGMLVASGWVKLAPLAVLPLWGARDHRRALVAAGAVTAITAAVLLLLGGAAGFADMFRALSFQAERRSLMSVWTLVDAPAAQIAFQAAVIAGITLAAVSIWRDRDRAADPRRMAALAAAVLIGVQLAANYWSASYLAWVFPLVAVALLTPSRSPALASSRRAGRR